MERSARDVFKERLAKHVDDRRDGLTHVERVSSAFPDGHILAAMANAMAIAMTYAQLEGFVKEALQLYVEYVESQNILRSEAIPCLVAYSWRPAFKRLMGKGSLDHRVSFAAERVAELTRPLVFSETEKRIDTQSNLKFEVLDELATMLGLNRDSLTAHKDRLNALVSKRNSIAHGSRSSAVSRSEVVKALECAREVMETIENCLHEAVDNASYRRVASSS